MMIRFWRRISGVEVEGVQDIPVDALAVLCVLPDNVLVVMEVLEMHKQGASQRAIAIRLGVGRQVVRGIIGKKN
jgi:hypothetical protein